MSRFQIIMLILLKQDSVLKKVDFIPADDITFVINSDVMDDYPF